MFGVGGTTITIIMDDVEARLGFFFGYSFI